MCWSWFRQVGNDTHDIHIDLSFTWQVLLLNYLSEQSMQWWGSSNGTRTRSPHTRTPRILSPWTLSLGQHPPASIPPWTTFTRTLSPHGQYPIGQHPHMDNIPLWTTSPMDNIPRTLSPHGQYPPGQHPPMDNIPPWTTSPRGKHPPRHYPPMGQYPTTDNITWKIHILISL